MHLDRVFGRAEIASDLLVELAGDDPVEDLVFARRERREARVDARPAPPARAGPGGPFEGRRAPPRAALIPTGFARNSTAPLFIAWTLFGTSACPLRKMIGGAPPRPASAC